MNTPSYKIDNIDQMDPFLMSITSSDNHWMFISSNGALTAGRERADHALFPYVTDNLIHSSLNTTGPLTILKANTKKNIETHIWKPFSHEEAKNNFQRNLYKDAIGDTIIFEEIHDSLGLRFRYQWFTSNEFGFIKRTSITNPSENIIEIEITDGLQNILPSGLDVQTQQSLSNLSNAYKYSEILDKTNIAVFSLGSLIVDRPDPVEALTANVVWCRSSLDLTYSLLLERSSQHLQDPIFKQHHLLTGAAGSYFVNAKTILKPGASAAWDIVLDVNLDHNKISRLKNMIPDIDCELEDSIKSNHDSLVKYIGNSDGLQMSSSENNNMHHTANVLFNIMRGGIFVDNYKINKYDLLDFIKTRNSFIYDRSIDSLDQLTDNDPLESIINLGLQSGDTSFSRLCYEYLPLTFGRRHGDPSRPWNQFNIKVSNDTSETLYHYEGNWRDIFQNWEGLSISFPLALSSMISKFLNACTQDGFNPYRINREGIDWEVIDPEDTWGHIGYWNDHQIIYLLKLLEAQWNLKSDFLIDNLDKKIFSSANIPYKIKDINQIFSNPKETIYFDHKLHNSILKQVERIGSDARLVLKNDEVVHVTLTEKLLTLSLAKVSNFIPDGGIWMNTQRPEWNDANNALVGYGVSMVTLYYLRRYLTFLNKLFTHSPASVSVSVEVAAWFQDTHSLFNKNKDYVDGSVTDPFPRRRFVEQLQTVFSDYRNNIYNQSSKGDKTVDLKEIVRFNSIVLAFIDRTILNNKDDGLYGSYNTINIQDDKNLQITKLYPMLEGQVAALSSGKIKSEEAIALLESLFSSKIYRKDQNSFMLYPTRTLKPFMEKNIIPEDVITKSQLLKKLIEQANTEIICVDGNNRCRFSSHIINANRLEMSLSNLGKNKNWEGLVSKEKKLIVDSYTEIFDHQNYTGRSGTMFAYEGIGSIYWHMVSKLLLATQEVFFRAIKNGEHQDIIKNLGKMYYKIRSGLSTEKTPQEYGAFPYDPYSHTPKDRGAQQPGMTGQVKEEIITRMSELGCRILEGQIIFDTSLLKISEFLDEEHNFTYVDIHQNIQSIELRKDQLGFTYCQVPIIYTLGKNNWTHTITTQDKTETTSDGNIIKKDLSHDVFSRTGKIQKINVNCPRSGFLF